MCRMPVKTKPKRIIREPLYPPDSFTREELRKAIKEVAAARRRRCKRLVANDAK
jgi:hypothetical protein